MKHFWNAYPTRSVSVKRSDRHGIYRECYHARHHETQYETIPQLGAKRLLSPETPECFTKKMVLHDACCNISVDATWHCQCAAARLLDWDVPTVGFSDMGRKARACHAIKIHIWWLTVGTATNIILADIRRTNETKMAL